MDKEPLMCGVVLYSERENKIYDGSYIGDGYFYVNNLTVDKSNFDCWIQRDTFFKESGLRKFLDDTTSASASAMIGEDAIVKEYNTNGIDMFILRNSTSYDAAAADIDSFLSTHPIIKAEGMFDEMKIVKTIDSKVLSGPRCFIGMVYFATTSNPSIDFGLTLDGVISDYNSQFGTNWSSEKLFYEA